jgi:hypothetical protein
MFLTWSHHSTGLTYSYNSNEIVSPQWLSLITKTQIRGLDAFTRPFPHRRPVSRGRTAAAPPPPLAGDSPGQSTATNRSRVSPIDDPCRLFAWPSSTSPSASLLPPSGPRGRDRGYFCEDFKSFRVRSAKRFFLVLWISPAPCKID